MSDQALLPPGFESLERFLAYWDRPTTEERWRQRTASSMEEIRRFYDAMLAKAPAAMAHIRQFPIDALPEPSARLMRLCLALVNASISVEMLGQPRVPYSPYPQPVRVIRGPVYWG
jgi:hypothetical protein